jgi:serine/threonine protein kinase
VTEADGTVGDQDRGEPGEDAADARLAEVLRGSTTGKDLRRAIDSEASPEAADLRARLDALDFVQQVVGGTEDMPQRLGEYEIKGLLGRGGMGTVYLGWQAELEREVALKVLSPAYSGDPTMRKRFRAEARATAAMHHRHIVPIYDYGESQGMLFFAMERVVGMSLDKHIAAARRIGKPPLPPLEAAQRFAGVADALGLAHRRRLLHRDVKPGNILVGSDGTLALTDFGLAKALDQASVRLTSKGGGFLGTLHYASPEQALGRELTPASDLYSLGVTMFEAIAGELPLHGKTTEALLQSILHGTPKRLRECVPQPPRDLELVLEKLLSREPADRYQDGEALARDLQRIADGEPVHIRRLPWHVRIYRRARKNPVLAGAIAATGLLLLLTLVLASVLRRETGRSLVLRHERNLIAIADDIARESGAPWGPAPLFAALTGQAPVPTAPSDAVLAALERASRELPGDIQVPAMREAYIEDPLPAASELLAAGRGFEAVLRYDEAIRDALAARTGGELSIELRLYRLYLGRGVANLLAAVGRINDARTDLALAAFLRPGSTFPRTLLDLLDVAQSGDVPLALQRLLRDLQPAAAARRRVVGALLVAMSGLWPLPAANLVDFGHGHQVRRQLYEAGLALHGPLPESGIEPGSPTGLSAHFAGLAQAVLQHRSDPVQMRLLAEQAEAEIVRSAHPEAALYGWRLVLQLLREPLQRGSLVDADGRALSAPLQLAVWDELLRLQPPREMMALWLQRFEQLRQREPNLPGMARIAAQVHTLAGTTQADALVGAWIAEAEGDPQALACRLRLRLRRGQLDMALDDSMALVQTSVARTLALRSVLALCEESLPMLEGAERAGVAALRQSFADLAGGVR